MWTLQLVIYFEVRIVTDHVDGLEVHMLPVRPQLSEPCCEMCALASKFYGIFSHGILTGEYSLIELTRVKEYSRTLSQIHSHGQHRRPAC